jgi:putative membrane protein
MGQVARNAADVMAGERTDLSIERTVMAADRTLMGWVRTALSLISFGFAIYKFLQAAAGDASVALVRIQGPRRLGLTLIALGIAAVVSGSIDYYRTVKRLNDRSDAHYKPLSFSFTLGIVVGLLGLFLFLTILIHVEIF